MGDGENCKAGISITSPHCSYIQLLVRIFRNSQTFQEGHFLFFLSFSFLFFFFFSVFSRPHPWHRGPIRAVATSLHQSHSYAGSEPCLRPIYHSSCRCRILNPLSKARDWTATSWFLVGFVNHWAMTGTPLFFLLMIFIFSIIAGLQCSVNFLLYGKVTQSHIHIHILFISLFSSMLHHK